MTAESDQRPGSAVGLVPQAVGLAGPSDRLLQRWPPDAPPNRIRSLPNGRSESS